MLLSIILILASSTARANVNLQQEADFREVNWGMSSTEVLETEKAELLAEEEAITEENYLDYL